MANDKIIIQEAKPNHAEQICRVLVRSIREVCINDHKNYSFIIKKWLKNKTPENVKKWIQDNNNYTLVATNYMSDVIGVSMVAKKGDILLNYLIPEYLNRGIGKQMLEKLEEFFKMHNINELRVYSTLTAKRFYLRNGFYKYNSNLDKNILLKKDLIK